MWEVVQRKHKECRARQPDDDQRPVSATDAALYSRHVIADLRLPTLRHGQRAMPLEGPPLLPVGWAKAWAGHSERASLPSLLAAIGAERTQRDLLGRWYLRPFDQDADDFEGAFLSVNGALAVEVSLGRHTNRIPRPS